MENEEINSSASARLKDGVESPIAYYYNAASSLDGVIEYINVYQCLNDKFVGRILQPQFFAVAEESDRIFTLNRKLIEEAIKEARKRPDYKFVVQLSTKWLVDVDHEEELMTLLDCAPENLVLSLDTQSLTLAGDEARKNYNKISTTFGIKFMLDNPEEAKLTALFEYKINYLRLDGRYYREENSIKSAYLRIYADYARAQGIKVVVQHVNTEEQKKFFKDAGLTLMEGQAIQNYKHKVVAITAPFDIGKE